MEELPREAKPLAMPDVARVGAAAFTELFGRLPRRGVLAICAAIIALENANGRALIQYNWGNLSGSGPAGYWVPSKIQQGQPARFQAFASHEQGARAWWRLMAKRYRSVLLDGDAHNPRGAVRELYRLGYVAPASPGEEVGYTAAVVKLYAQALDQWIPASRVYPSGLVPLSLAASSLAAAVAFEVLS